MTVRREWLEKDYYDILGVDRAATERAIKTAYRKLAQQSHPDNNPGDEAAEARFRDVAEAYDVLGDPKERAEYNQARDAFARGAYAGGPGGGQTQYVRVEDIVDLGDILGGFGGMSDLFGGGGRRSRAGSDIEATVSLTFHEALAGVTKKVDVAGRVVTVKIPAGIDDGAKIRLRGKGAPGAGGGPAGDLYVRVGVGSHPIFGRKGRNLAVEVPITFAEATLGAKVIVPTLDGTVTVKVPPGTQPGRTLRVSGKGVTTPKGVGDLMVTVTVAVPESITDEQRDLLKQFAESEPNPRNP